MFNGYVAEILNQNIIIDDILGNLDNQTVFLIKGKRGQGKTFLANELIRKLNNKYRYFFLSNEKKININEYEPFWCIIKEEYILKENLKNQLFDISQEYPLTKMISKILKIFSKEKTYTKLSNFNDDEAKLILFLNNEIKSKKVIWFCDNVHLWSNSSKKLLLSIIRYKKKFAGLKKLKIVILANSECDYFDEDCNLSFKLRDFNGNEFKKMLPFMYPDSLDFYNKSDKIYGISNQNLKITGELYDIIKDEQSIDFKNLREVVLKHFEDNVENGLDILIFLEKVAFLGAVTLKKLLEIFLDTEKNNQYSDYLLKAISMKILDTEEENVKFINTLIYDSIVNAINYNEKKEDYKKLSECISLLFPSNYLTRAKYLLYADEKKQAQVQMIVYCLQHFRQKKEVVQSSDIDLFQTNQKLREFYKNIMNIYKLYYGNDLEKNTLEKTIVDMYSLVYGIEELEFEIEYIKALYYINYSYRRVDFDEAKEILIKWYSNPNFKNYNFEMWVRTAILLMDLYYELNIETEKRKDIEKQLNKVSKEYPFDSYMKDICYILYLKSNMYNEIQIAFYKTENALKYFYDNIDIHNTQQYLVSAINHSANCLVLGKYADAYNIMQNLTSNNNILIDKLYPEAIANNLILSSYLCNKCCIKEAIKNMEKIAKYKSADNILIKNNLSTLYAESGDLGKASDISEELYQQIKGDEGIDDYYRYFVINNYLILKFLNGEAEISIKKFKDIENLYPLQNNIDYFKARNKYIMELLNHIDNSELLSTNKWNLYLIEKYPCTIGEAWNFWGKLLLLSDLQIWSDC